MAGTCSIPTDKSYSQPLLESYVVVLSHYSQHIRSRREILSSEKLKSAVFILAWRAVSQQMTEVLRSAISRLPWTKTNLCYPLCWLLIYSALWRVSNPGYTLWGFFFFAQPSGLHKTFFTDCRTNTSDVSVMIFPAELLYADRRTAPLQNTLIGHWLIRCLFFSMLVQQKPVGRLWGVVHTGQSRPVPDLPSMFAWFLARVYPVLQFCPMFSGWYIRTLY